MMRRLAIVLLAAWPALATAQVPPIEEIVIVTAHAEEVPFQTLARTVVVITQEQIARLPARSVTDLLSYVASVDVRSRGPFGVQADLSVRGATFGQVLVLVDGLRLNDAQSGHHNSDIPVPLDEIERIEVLMGPGSSLYGADAFGGTVNVITRRTGARRQASVSAGSFGFVSGDAAWAGTLGSVRESLAVSASRSSGFETDRDFGIFNASSQTSFGNGSRLRVSHLRKDFGANGYYGPAQSTERTNQTVVAVDGRVAGFGSWSGQWQAAYRTHGDVFLYDRTRPGVPNRHRTHATEAGARLQRAFSAGTTLTLGGEAGGDWIRSNNLGPHAVARGSGYAELQQRIGSQTFIYPALRLDGYSTFGSALSPSVAASTWLGPGVKLRGAVGRAFRVPTYTERFYVDPNNLGTPTLVPERAWSSEVGLDWLAAPGWTTSVAVFDRREHDTIDFVRASVQERWQAANIRRVETRGVEAGVRHALGAAGVVSAQYAWVNASTDPLPLLSKYVLEYARHSLTLAASGTLPGGFDLGQRVDYRQRRDGREYWLVDTRLGRRLARATVFVEGANLLDTRYQEIVGVNMPGRSLRAGVTVRGGS